MRIAGTILRLFLLPLILAAGTALLVRATCFRMFAIPSDSMAPTLVRGDQIAVTPYRKIFRTATPQVGEVVVFRRANEGWFVKRIVAGPGDHIESRRGHLRRNGRTVAEAYVRDLPTDDVAPDIVPSGSYFVLGDNRTDSIDSRVFGLVPEEAIYGRARLVCWSSSGVEWNERARASAGRADGTRLLPDRGSRILRPVE